MRQYFTYRDTYTPNGFVSPDGHLLNNFPGLAFTFELAIAQGYINDGRKLGCVDAASQNIIDVVLRSFPTDVETVQQAQTKYNLWTGRSDTTISGDILIIPKQGI